MAKARLQYSLVAVPGDGAHPRDTVASEARSTVVIMMPGRDSEDVFLFPFRPFIHATRDPNEHPKSAIQSLPFPSFVS